MSNKKLKIVAKTNMFGTNLTVDDVDGVCHNIGEQLGYDPLVKMRKRLAGGYLFRSPKLQINKLEEIWPTTESFTGPYAVWIQQDSTTKEFTAYARIEDKSDATMFAFAHSLFEKWSEEKEKQSKKSSRDKGPKLEVGKDGSIKVRVTATVLDDE